MCDQPFRYRMCCFAGPTSCSCGAAVPLSQQSLLQLSGQGRQEGARGILHRKGYREPHRRHHGKLRCPPTHGAWKFFFSSKRVGSASQKTENNSTTTVQLEAPHDLLPVALVLSRPSSVMMHLLFSNNQYVCATEYVPLSWYFLPCFTVGTALPPTRNGAGDPHTVFPCAWFVVL